MQAGENPEGDGWAPSLTLESECIDNPNSCDVVGAFLNNICVGWVYADPGGFTTIPLMGDDGSEYSAGYMLNEEVAEPENKPSLTSPPLELPPPETATGVLNDDGYYWIEWPLASGTWYFRSSSEIAWAKFENR